MEKNKLNGKDLDQLKFKDVSIETLKMQLNAFEEGFPFADLNSSATINNGIFSFDDCQIAYFRQCYRKHIEQADQKLSIRGGILKFVPASGAATRMFKDLYALLNECKHKKAIDIVLNKSQLEFFSRIKDFAFYESLSNEYNKMNPAETLDEAISACKYSNILHVFLESGLCYGNMPKALLLFHSYENRNCTSIEEHFMESAGYASLSGLCRLHFTVSSEFRELFKKEIERIKPFYEEKYNLRYEISFSEQKPSTDTVAVTMQNEILRDEEQKIVFRPGGHGALIENLNEVASDIIFIKNIDNVTTEERRADTIKYKETLAGLLIDRREKTYALLNSLKEAMEEGENGIREEEWEGIYKFIKEELQIRIRDEVATWPPLLRCKYLFYLLNRPMRVCGMVKNEGEPGGGPFWVCRVRTYESGEEDTNELRLLPVESLQIVESTQINHEDEEQEKIFKSSTHFNPVDLVCSVYDYRGVKFDLRNYIDPMTAFISEKSVQGVDIKAMELPGLWNGAMADWITLFVEEPISVFTPVKTVNDLLRPVHQSK